MSVTSIDLPPTPDELAAMALVLRVGVRTLFEGPALDDDQVLVVGSARDGAHGGLTHAVVDRLAAVPAPLDHDPPLEGPTTPEAGEAIVVTYFDLLEAGHAERAAACFSVDAVYSTPPPAGSQVRGLVVGRDAIRAAFVARGTNAARHHVEATATDGEGRFMIDGWVSGIAETGGSFVSSFWVDADGLICRYVAVLKVPRVVDNDGTSLS
jgi:ketosteroid isomerase-like protein